MNTGTPLPWYRNYTEKEVTLIIEDIRQHCNISSTLFNTYLGHKGANFVWWHIIFVSCYTSGV